jgi:hypothetical protein
VLHVDVSYPIDVFKILSWRISFEGGRRNIHILDRRLTHVSVELFYQVVWYKLIGRIILRLRLLSSTFSHVFVGHWVLLNTVWPA